VYELPEGEATAEGDSLGDVVEYVVLVQSELQQLQCERETAASLNSYDNSIPLEAPSPVDLVIQEYHEEWLRPLIVEVLPEYAPEEDDEDDDDEDDDDEESGDEDEGCEAEGDDEEFDFTDYILGGDPSTWSPSSEEEWAYYQESNGDALWWEPSEEDY